MDDFKKRLRQVRDALNKCKSLEIIDQIAKLLNINGGDNMTTLQGSKGRRYEVQSTLYGTRNLVQRLYYGGIFLAGTDQRGPAGESSTTLEDTIDRANQRADALGVEIIDN